MKTQRLQAAFARRREADFARIEKTAAVNKYFDHWSKVTSRFESWTDPEYYQQAEDTMRKDREKKQREVRLEDRRDKLRKLLNAENAEYEEELRLMNKPKPRKVSTEVLEGISKNQKYLSEEKRRLDLESKLYGKWRYGINDENLLFESKTDNQTLAKLNWLDKQIENRMLQEEETRHDEERRLKLLEETRKREENLKEQQKIREAEIKELRGMQESNLAELKTREIQSNHLRETETNLRRILDKINKEITDLTARQANRPNTSVPHNIKRIKMFIRQRSEEIRSELQNDIHILNRILNCRPCEDARDLQSQFEQFYKAELQKQPAIEAMYESEAKQNLIKWETEWETMSQRRQLQITQILQKIRKSLELELSENLDEQNRLVEIRQQHLAFIENSNGRLKAIVREEENYIQANDLADVGSREVGGRKKADGMDEASLKMGECGVDGDDETPRRPQFGRKKVAWT